MLIIPFCMNVKKETILFFYRYEMAKKPAATKLAIE